MRCRGHPGRASARISNAAWIGLQSARNPLKSLSRFVPRFAEKLNKINGEIRTLTPLILVRIQVPQPASPVSGVLFPGGVESPTFPRVSLAQPSLWSASDAGKVAVFGEE